MNTIKSFSVAFLLLIGVASAHATDLNPSATVGPVEEIQTLLENPQFSLDATQNVVVSFTINEEGELVVLCVRTEDKRIKDYVKQRLNYKKLKTPGLRNGGKYFLPLTVLAKS